MKKIYTIFIISLCVLTGCNDDLWNDSLTPEQQALIGKAVQFDPYVELFNTTRVAQSYDHNGGFNANDMMYMYRQYQENGKWVYKTPPGTIYKYTELTNGETGIFEKNSWKVYEGKKFNFQDQSYDNGTPYSKLLTKGDSITWESGVTVRFRAWVLSRLGNDLTDKDAAGGKEKTVNYPDYMVCDWVTVSGPTNSIPMAMRHLGCRLGFSPHENNQFAKIEITYDPNDYMREDNADTNEHDEADKYPATSPDGIVLTAQQCADNVKAVYESMCWPGGVNMDDLSLMTNASGADQGNIKHGTLTQEQIATQTRRPSFNSSVDSRLYMVTIPYDMSNDPYKKDQPITLPPYTRFRVWLHDVNNGDGQHETTNNPNSGAPGASENHYHIFSLSDVMIKKDDGDVQAFPNGITLRSGYSYLFTVGYNYKTLEVYAEDNFSWAEQDLAITKATNKVETKPTAQNYAWWTNAISTACAGTKTGTQYEPTFQIQNETELQELINLVNGNFNTSGLYNGETLKKAVTINYDHLDKRKEVSRTVRWYAGIGQNGDGSPDTLWVDKTLLEDAGYIFYDKYTPSIADRSAIIEEDYLKGPYTFYDEQVRRRLSVTLTADIDLKDWKFEPIGKDESHPFSGYFDGGGYLLSNVYMGFDSSTPHFGDGTTLFGYVKDGTVANLRLESTHPLSVTNKLENGRIVGCSVIAPSTQATLANSTSGFCSFIGCFHQGSSNSPLVNNADRFEMYGCMQVASGISGTALANVASNYDPTNEDNFIFSLREDMALDSVGWTNAACNYYDTELSTGAKAFSFTNGVVLPKTQIKDGKSLEIPFHRIQYIRGVPTHIMCAKNDFLIDNKTEWMKLTPQRRKEIYGAAPWKAMNFGIFMYNSNVADDKNRCNMHYENDSDTGYSHRYPQLKKNEPLESQYVNVLQQFN